MREDCHGVATCRMKRESCVTRRVDQWKWKWKEREIKDLRAMSG